MSKIQAFPFSCFARRVMAGDNSMDLGYQRGFLSPV
jgi:hypothetical protein